MLDQIEREVISDALESERQRKKVCKEDWELADGGICNCLLCFETHIYIYIYHVE